MQIEKRTKLDDEAMLRVRKAVVSYLQQNEFITNRLLRGLTHIGYDQCIYVFGELLRSGDLTKIGKASGTRYVLPNKTKVLKTMAHARQKD